MGEFVDGIANVAGESKAWVITFVSQRQLLSSEREALANAIKSLAESFDCTADIVLEDI